VLKKNSQKLQKTQHLLVVSLTWDVLRSWQKTPPPLLPQTFSLFAIKIILKLYLVSARPYNNALAPDFAIPGKTG